MSANEDVEMKEADEDEEDEEEISSELDPEGEQLHLVLSFRHLLVDTKNPMNRKRRTKDQH
jgi:hypothetical protein